MNFGSFLRVFLLASISCVVASTSLPFQSEKNPILPIREPFKLTLSIDQETYSRIADSLDDENKLQVQLILDLRLRFINQTNRVVKLDVNCILLDETVIYDSPVVGPPEPLPVRRDGDISIPLHACPYVADEKLLPILPGEFFETTQRMRFKVVSRGAFHPPETLKPGEYFLKITETTWWEIEGQDESLKEKRRKLGVLVGRVVPSELLSFVVKGKPVKRKA